MVKIIYSGDVPSVNHIWGRSGNRTFMTKKGKDFKQELGLIAKLSGAKLLLGDVSIKIEQHHKVKGRIDIDNISKGILDALNGICYADDRQIIDLHLTKHRNSFMDGLVIYISSL